MIGFRSLRNITTQMGEELAECVVETSGEKLILKLGGYVAVAGGEGDRGRKSTLSTLIESIMRCRGRW